ncbi:LOW QUALITY PROTEIN: sugar transporter ERD6-like 4 [Drosophila eugracilis]|uniref:LOW QUALITY PROTEIN: sugar transporter ERD6-like 4 n=1 Tax=Drosophila eugracilis TaxID=29029 RepID=UPI001BDA5E67|nr:LOW QUALITY PROTEIN: sugar transporter ERD6-like 4 [Drosophila eugracilis]
MTVTYVTAGPEEPNPFTTEDFEGGYIPKPPPPQPPTQTVNLTINNQGSLRQINKQLNVGCAVFFLYVYGGMDLAHSSGWNQTLNTTTATQSFKCSWFIGVLAGAAVASMAMTFLPKLPFYVLGGLMQLTGSIIFTCAPFDYGCLMAARYVAGAGIGLITVPFLIHSAEVASDNYRGASGSMEQCGLALGIAIQVIYDTQWVDDKEASVNEVHGIIGIVFSILGLGMTALSIESPIFHLRRNQKEKARECHDKLLGSFNNSVDQTFEEANLYVTESQNRTFFQELWISVVPFVKVLLFRGFVAFSFSMPLSESLIKSTLLTEGYISCWPVTLWGLVRLLGALVAQSFLDKIGRKLISLVGLLCMAILMICMAASYANPTNVLLTYYMNQVWKLGVAFQAVAGLFVCSSSVYMGEAFPMKVKPLLVGYIVGFEQTVHIIDIVGYNRGAETFFYHYYLSVGIILFVGVIIFGIVIPETKKITLREARKRFNRLHNIRLF